MPYTQELAALGALADPLLRRARFMGLLSREVRRVSGKVPVVVGGHAVEIFTQGGYASLDIDVKGPREAMHSLLLDMGFAPYGNNYVHPGLDLFVQWLGEGPDPRSEDPDRLVDVDLGDGLFIRLVGFEDLVLDRLRAAKFWKHADSRFWAERILAAAAVGGAGRLDLDYLRRRAREDEVDDVLESALAGAGVARP